METDHGNDKKLLILLASPDRDLNLARVRLLEQLGHRTRMVEPGIDLAEQVGEADVIVPSIAKISPEVIAAAPRLKLIVQMGVGLDTVDVAAATARGIPVVNMPDVNSTGVAETAMLLMLAVAKRLPAVQSVLKEGRFRERDGTELAGKTLAILGLGNSGTALAARAHAFGMRVLAIKQHPAGTTNPYVEAVSGPEDLNKVLARADFVSLHLPLNATTRGLIDAGRLEVMKRNAYLINVARGPLIVKDDLLQALKAGRLAGVGLDVFWEEPPDPSDPIFSFDRVVATPHIGGLTHEMHERSATRIDEILAEIDAGRVPKHCVNM